MKGAVDLAGNTIVETNIVVIRAGTSITNGEKIFAPEGIVAKEMNITVAKRANVLMNTLHIVNLFLARCKAMRRMR